MVQQVFGADKRKPPHALPQAIAASFFSPSRARVRYSRRSGAELTALIDSAHISIACAGYSRANYSQATCIWAGAKIRVGV
jgi:hypothetical protein